MAPLKRRRPREPVNERLDRLLTMLASEASSTGPALAAELGVSLRTVRRDLARLEARGVPIEAERGRGGGVRVSARAGLGRLQLKDREAIDLLLALAIAERIGSPLLLTSLNGLRRKLAIAFPPQERAGIGRLRKRILHAPRASERLAATWVAPHVSVLQPIQDAFFEQRAVEVVYRTARERTTRVVEPHYLMVAWPAWFLLVWDHLRHQVRMLRLDRIESARLCDQRFTLRGVDEMLTVARDLFVAL